MFTLGPNGGRKRNFSTKTHSYIFRNRLPYSLGTIKKKYGKLFDTLKVYIFYIYKEACLSFTDRHTEYESILEY